MQRIRFVGGHMDGKRGADEYAPLVVRFTPPGEPMEEYRYSMTDDDGTLIYRKK